MPADLCARRACACFFFSCLRIRTRAWVLCAGAMEDIGIVERAPNSSDEDSGDEDDIDDIADDDHGRGKLPPGQARVR